MRKGSHHSKESIEKSIKSHRGQIPWNKGKTGVYSEDTRKQIGDSLKGKVPWMKGRKHSAESKLKNSLAHKGKKLVPLSDETKKKISDARKGREFTEEHINNLSKSHMGQRSWNKGIPQTEEQKIKNSKSHIGLLVKDRNPNWKGGASFEPYCPKFTQRLREEVRDAFGRKCFLCGTPEGNEKLSVHHCDYNKGQGCGQRWSLVPLCRHCHMLTTHHRHYYFNLLSNYWAMNIEFVINGLTYEAKNNSPKAACSASYDVVRPAYKWPDDSLYILQDI